MSYIEVKKGNDIEYASFVKKFRLMGKTYRIRKHIGKNISTINKGDGVKRTTSVLFSTLKGFRKQSRL